MMERILKSVHPSDRHRLTLLAPLPPKEILPQEVRTGPPPRQTGGDLSGAVVGGADGLHHGGRHPGERRGGIGLTAQNVSKRLADVCFPADLLAGREEIHRQDDRFRSPTGRIHGVQRGAE